uniref:Uncharacterized protein n=1 Tax=Vespula pensylvanica TaxID=30213 RepID=A0A834KW97_VESPE|nr:hypothetical protein H0235_012947 [Vespula pensylvanica]
MTLLPQIVLDIYHKRKVVEDHDDLTVARGSTLPNDRKFELGTLVIPLRNPCQIGVHYVLWEREIQEKCLALTRKFLKSLLFPLKEYPVFGNSSYPIMKLDVSILTSFNATGDLKRRHSWNSEADYQSVETGAETVSGEEGDISSSENDDRISYKDVVKKKGYLDRVGMEEKGRGEGKSRSYGKGAKPNQKLHLTYVMSRSFRNEEGCITAATCNGAFPFTTAARQKRGP